MEVEVREEHRWLQKLAGEWTFEAETVASPTFPASKHPGTESARSLDGVWMVLEGRGEAPGGDSGKSIMTLGFDPAKGRFVGTFVASMMHHLWIYEGELDAGRNALTLHTEGPGVEDDGRMAKYRDVITFEDDDHRVMTSSYQRDDGTWQLFMTARYTKSS